MAKSLSCSRLKPRTTRSGQLESIGRPQSNESSLRLRPGSSFRSGYQAWSCYLEG